MTPQALRKLRQEKKISLLDIAARTGLPEEYLEKIEEGKVVALESDLARIHRAILQTEADKLDPEYEKEERKDYDNDELNELL